jgi:hypothetical protein
VACPALGTVPYYSRSPVPSGVMQWFGQQPDEQADCLLPSGHLQVLVRAVGAPTRVAQAEQDRRLAESLSQQASRGQ